LGLYNTEKNGYILFSSMTGVGGFKYSFLFVKAKI